VSNFLVSLLLLTSLQISPFTSDIEKSFLQNNDKMLFALFPENGYINISFPDPISFSDQISSQQAYYLFKNIFSSFSTFEFYSELPFKAANENSFILKTRWSFRNRKNRHQYVFQVFFYITKLEDPSNEPGKHQWQITELKAAEI